MTLFKRFVFLFAFVAGFLLVATLPVSAKSVIPGGSTIGIELRTRGLMVSGTYDVKVDQAIYNPARDADIQKGDLLLYVEKQKMETLSDLLSLLKSKGNTVSSVPVILERQGALIERKLRLLRNDVGQSWRTGLLIKERLLGIGTITFFDPETNTYGALGHEIIDQDTGQLFDVNSGTIYGSSVTEVKKSENGKPGEKIASIDENTTLGTVILNNRYGIFGVYDPSEIDSRSSPLIEIGSKDTVQVGPAEIWTVIKGTQIEKYAIEIILVRSQDQPDTRSFTFKVTDPRLLKETNGIIQGMSGSPIIQNNHLIGAVTHVLVDRVDMGHGIFIEWMLLETEKLSEES